MSPTMSLSTTLYPLLRTDSNQEDRSRHHLNFFDWDVKNQNKQNIILIIKKLLIWIYAFFYRI